MSLINKFGVLRILNHKYLINNACKTCGSVLSVFSSTKQVVHSSNVSRYLHISLPRNASHFKARDRRDLLKSMPKMDEGTEGEHTVSLDAVIRKEEDMFTDDKTPDLLFNNIPFREIPIVHVNVTKNNTKVTLTDFKGKVIYFRTCGLEGFKNCRKGTNVAGQTTALTVGTNAINAGIKDVRLKVQGMGPGRMAAIKGLQMGGLNIISVTDDTRISFKPSARPRKPRRL